MVILVPKLRDRIELLKSSTNQSATVTPPSILCHRNPRFLSHPRHTPMRIGYGGAHIIIHPLIGQELNKLIHHRMTYPMN